MDANKEAVLRAIFEIQADSNNYVADNDIAKRTGLNLEDVRGYMDLLEDEDLLQSANSHSGNSAHLYPKHKLLAKQLFSSEDQAADNTPDNTPVEIEDVAGWYSLKKLGEGGQGAVFLVRDERELSNRDLYLKAAKSINSMTDMSHGDDVPREAAFGEFREVVREISRAEDLSRLGALKILHSPEDARDYELASIRIRNEIQAMQGLDHPHLLKILDADSSYRWYVSQFHPRGELVSNLGNFAGKPLQALQAFRPLVEAVGKVHESGFVHRDIKPQNIFIGANQELILGDFGLVFFEDDNHTRVSNTFSNLGSRDWMPFWAQGKRIDEVKPTFDVFSLGKVLWSMVSGKQTLLGWYFANERHIDSNVENLFPDAPGITLINPLLSLCVVEHEDDCLNNAQELLLEVDQIIEQLECQSAIAEGEFHSNCHCCALGKYELSADQDSMEVGNFGLSPRGARSFKVFQCNRCGHVQLFSFTDNQIPEVWKKSEDKP